MINIISTELKKYTRVFYMIILLFLIAQGVLFIVFKIMEYDYDHGGLIGIDFFKIYNYGFAAIIFSGFPLTIMLTISNEFSTGYAPKLISNGMTRKMYLFRKHILAITLSFISVVIYTIFFFAEISFINLWENNLIPEFFIQLLKVLFISIFWCGVAVSLSLITRNWYSILIFFGYNISEGTITYFFEGKKTLPYFPNKFISNIFYNDFNYAIEYLWKGTLISAILFILLIFFSRKVFFNTDLK